METIRTISCKLETALRQKNHIEDTLKAFADACNVVAGVGREKKERRQFTLHKLCYRVIREKFGLSANLTVRAIARVAISLKRKPNSIFRPTSIDFDERIFAFSEKDWSAKLTLLNSREKFYLDIGKYQRNALAGKHPTSAQLVKRNREYFLNIQIKEESPEPKKTNSILGIDLGIKKIAVTSDGKSFCGKELNAYRLLRHKVRKSLQSNAHKGSPSTQKNCRRILKRLSGKQSRRTKHINHEISKQIVEHAKSNNQTIALESLKGIRERTNKRLRRSQKGLHNTWSFYQLKSMILYKAQRVGVPVVEIDPRYTSQICSQCLHVGVRRGESFTCTHCGYCSDADFNGSRNIATVGAVFVDPLENSRILSCSLH